MKRAEILSEGSCGQEVRKMRFEEAYEGWNRGRLTQEEVVATRSRDEQTYFMALLLGGFFAMKYVF